MAKAKSRARVTRKTRQKIDHMHHLRGRHGTKVGLPKGSGRYPDGTEVIDVGIQHEFGIPGVLPERSWLRHAIRTNLRKYRTFNKKALRQILFGDLKPSIAMQRLGLEAMNDVQDRIRDISTPPNAPATVDRKGFNNPLIHTGLFRQSVTFEVLKRVG